MAIPILLVPGLNCTAEVYHNQLPALWRFGPVTIANHLRGAGMAEIAASILADAPPRFALAGFSMGGYIAFEILRQAADRVTALALLDTSARPDTAEATEKRRAAMALAGQGKFTLAIQQSFPNGVHPAHVTNPHLKALHTRMARANGPETYIRHQQAIITRPDSRPDLPAIKVPTLVVVGEADSITVPEAAREMATNISGATLVTVPNAGHMALVEQPDAVTAAMVEWLDAIKS
ncbi:MAG: alpha/beta fold hydrolase [Devosia sp.]|uniref:alpha/beta fold hydrolase n=1 Tax=Devosia sp. TaxID=1871048 RepID=UPI001AD2A75C|nr:alpha/beta fold hydrolase [Devosia sp.]MBN9314490.1 alpha/beta fold hydrolase [Devosia sp.]